jgi:alanine racemase
MQPEERSFDAMVQYGLEPEVYSMDFLELFSSYLKEKNIRSYPVHLKFNTGMNRLGFEPEEGERVIEKIKLNGLLQVKSVFSHLAASDEPQHDEFTRGQIEKFQEIRTAFQQAFPHQILFHILNSAGIERFPGAAMDMVRLGIGMYGVSALEGSPVKPISTFKSTIIQIKKVSPPETVGYGRKGTLPGEREIAVVPIGYADGLDRKLSNGQGAFMIHGKKAPVIGNVCMDVTMADVTGLGAREGDEAILFGKEQTINDLAKTLGTIPYEILTSVSNRVKRVYVQE